MIVETPSGIILPGHPFFDQYLYGTLPPGWRNYAFHNPDFAFVARAGSGLLEAVSEDELDEYLEGGEYDDRLEEIGDNTDEYDY
ncbi:hypothetical protein NIES4075_44570 [Tolypothrix sp. NIES-4075]|uniref:hypothetical protein n=1 Tax=Tolypothrix sp. NIES-4075 TaxID=2005459 RepID=UPI000B5C21CF|nr:hypothetical protein [Tolypothrix sp. NIES-4075]GAX43444.1 hypothetical protein NIES4075_44570 [Tolypothrix sp. NIES-4075]